MRRTESASAARRAQGRESRARIVDAALGLIAERGYAATSVGEVCRRAGLAKPVLYWHFESKEGLLGAVVESVGSIWIERLRKQVQQEGDPLQRLDRLIDGWREILVEQPQLIRLPMVVLLEQSDVPAIREAVLRVIRRAEGAIVQAIEDALGSRLDDLDLVATTILHLLEGAVVRCLAEPDTDLDRLFSMVRRTAILVLADRLPDAPTRAAGAALAAVVGRDARIAPE